MVRDPSIVSPSLTGVFIGGGHTNTVQDRGARCRGSVVPPLPDGDGGVTDRATRGACSAGSGIVWRTTSLGLRPPRQHPITPPGLCGVEPLRDDGQAHLISSVPLACESRRLINCPFSSSVQERFYKQRGPVDWRTLAHTSLIGAGKNFILSRALSQH